jgi:hypothetical protein
MWTGRKEGTDRRAERQTIDAPSARGNSGLHRPWSQRPSLACRLYPEHQTARWEAIGAVRNCRRTSFAHGGVKR